MLCAMKAPIMNEPIILESNQNHATITDNGVCPTLPASMGMGGGYVPMVVEIHENTNGFGINSTKCRKN